MPPEGWEQPGFNDAAWGAATELGDACMFPFAKYRDFTKDFATAEERAAIVAATNAIEVIPLPAGLENEPESNVKVVYDGYRPFIDVNGERLEPDWNLCGSAHDYALTSIVKTRALGYRFFRIYAARQRGRRDAFDVCKKFAAAG